MAKRTVIPADLRAAIAAIQAQLPYTQSAMPSVRKIFDVLDVTQRTILAQAAEETRVGREGGVSKVLTFRAKDFATRLEQGASRPARGSRQYVLSPVKSTPAELNYAQVLEEQRVVSLKDVAASMEGTAFEPAARREAREGAATGRAARAASRAARADPLAPPSGAGGMKLRRLPRDITDLMRYDPTIAAGATPEQQGRPPLRGGHRINRMQKMAAEAAARGTGGKPPRGTRLPPGIPEGSIGGGKLDKLAKKAGGFKHLGKTVGGGVALLTLLGIGSSRKQAREIREMEVPSADDLLGEMRETELMASRQARIMRQDPELYQSLMDMMSTGGDPGPQLARGQFIVGQQPTPATPPGDREIQQAIAALGG